METNGSNPATDYDRLFKKIQELVLCHSPSGMETEVDQIILKQFKSLNLETWQDRAGNIIAKIPGQSDGAIAITAQSARINSVSSQISPPA